MLGAWVGRWVLVTGILSLLGGCQNVGPIAIDQGRDRYNSTIQATAKTQTLSNIVRAHNNEPTSFMDVTEVDTGTSFSGTISGAVTGIGAKPGTTGGTLAGQIGSVSPGVSYSEAPTIRYLPLTGQGLVEQLINPLSTDALESLYNSSWKAGPLFDLATVYATFDTDYDAAAANIIAVLSAENWISLIATKSELTKTQDAAGAGSQSPPGMQNQSKSGQVVTVEVTSKQSGTDAGNETSDSLTVFLRPWDQTIDSKLSLGRLYFWIELLVIYSGTQSDFMLPHSKHEDLAFCQSHNLFQITKQTTAKTDEQPTLQTTTTTNTTTIRSHEARPETIVETTRETSIPTSKVTTTPNSYQLNKQGLQRLLENLRQNARHVASDRRYLISVRKCLPDSIELRTASVSPGKGKDLVSVAPLLKTYSGLGILKHAGGQNSPKFAFINPDEYRKIRSYEWNYSKIAKTFDFYTLLPCDD